MLRFCVFFFIFLSFISTSFAQEQDPQTPQNIILTLQWSNEPYGEPPSIQAVLWKAIKAYVEKPKKTDGAATIQILPDGNMLIEDQEGSILICEKRYLTDDQPTYKITFITLERVRPQSEASVQAFVYAALQDYYDSEDCSRAVLEFKEDGTFILKRGEITLLCKKDLMIGRKNGPSLESALARLETVFENRGVEPVWFTQDLVRGLDRDMLERAGRVNAEALARYLEFRLASADLEEDLAVDRDSVAFKTLLEEMQRGRISVLEKLPHLTRIFLREGLKQIKER